MKSIDTHHVSWRDTAFETIFGSFQAVLRDLEASRRRVNVFEAAVQELIANIAAFLRNADGREEDAERTICMKLN